MKDALIIVDYSYDFVALDGKLTCGEPAITLESALYAKWEQYVNAGKPVYVLMDLHFENDTHHPESKLFLLIILRAQMVEIYSESLIRYIKEIKRMTMSTG